MHQNTTPEVERAEPKSYRFFLVGLRALDLLVEAVDLVFEVLKVLLIFFLLLEYILQTPLLFLVILLVFSSSSCFIVKVYFQFPDLVWKQHTLLFSTRVLIEDTTLTSPAGDGTARQFTCSPEQREGLAVRRAKTVTSLSSYFKTLRSGPASGLNPRPSSRVPKFSLSPVIPIVILGILQSRISPQFCFKISNRGLEIRQIPYPELQKREIPEIPHPEKRIGDPLPLCSQAKRSADWARAPATSGWNPRPSSLQSSVPLIELVLPTRGQMLKLSLHTWLCIAILRDWIILISFSCIQSIQIPAFLHSLFFLPPYMVYYSLRRKRSASRLRPNCICHRQRWL